MAKQYYTLSESAQLLRMTEDQVKSLVREGKLREYRDAGKVHYRADEVDRLAAKEGSSIVDLAIGENEPAADIGLSSSDVIMLEGDDEAKREKEDTKITSVGINVFDDDELQIEADPMAETRITAAPEEVALGGGTGSGSGLMDLTRESDDTSLGAELLDVISPTEGGETETAAAAEAEATLTEPVGAAAQMDAFDVAAPVTVAPVVRGEPSGGPFTGLIVATVLILGFVGFVAASAMQGVWPGFLESAAAGMNLYIYILGGSAVVAGIGALIGFLSAKSGAGGKRPAMR